ncbi:helix-turn-helix domain-containing protein [Paraflavitalea sp. CAU 1676]|uniref:GlxA family transcriptional regulator n=1 Tax=Paraflavitalea sp. CAU 1676 TaxID=3032598 RepID=UPI0023DCDBE4|nr:helix-turn-helix domain-containing protein [Paraflavitalea sp. CAU 1676]MDF2191788.1 helix-turn-helix domain-containing protein [Paraflavitalea sp. CAU 1676]
MKHVSILVLKGATVSSIDGSLQIFSRVNDFLKHKGQEPFYRIEVIATEHNTSIGHGLYAVQANRLLKEVTKSDLIILPTVCGDFGKIVEQNKDYYDWIIDQYHRGAEVAGLCVGSYCLAATGLLNGKQCAIHWASAEAFQQMYPAIHVIADKIITDDQAIYTSGGGYSYLNLLLYIIEKHLGREISILASKMFQIDYERKDQTPFAIFVGQKQHGDSTVVNAQEFIEANYQEKISVDELSEKNHIGRRTFERRFKKSTGNSINEYIQRVRVEAAKRQLEAGRKTINEVIYEVGYSDLNAFRSVFKKYTGLSPIDYRNKYKA